MSPIFLTGLIVLFSTLAFGQRPGSAPSSSSTDLNVRVVYDGIHPVGEHLRVMLMSQGGAIVAEGYTGDRGELRFNGLRPGSYRLRVSGAEIEAAVEQSFLIEPGMLFSSQMLSVKLKETEGRSLPAAGPVSASQLNVPEKAKKEFEKGQELLNKQKPDEAMKRFEKAAEIYPQYAAAFDMMGIVKASSSLSDAKQYFERSIQEDRDYLPAYSHLAKVRLKENNNADAERLLSRAVSMDPRSAEEFFLLAFAQAKQSKFESAIQNCLRTHQLPHDKFALVHFIAAESYSMIGKPTEATEQYSLYLKEAPLGPNADLARTKIKALQAQLPRQ
jgi:tetratricopeptide (TPR) repeat protein